MIRQPPINRLIDKTLALDEPRKRVILRLFYSLYSIHNRKSQIAAKMIFSGKARKETGKFPVNSCMAAANKM